MSDEFDTLFDEPKTVETKVEEPEEEKPKEKPKTQPKTQPKTPKKPKEDLHFLNEKNVMIFVKQVNRTKKYEMKHRFYNSSALEISEIIDKLIEEGKLERFKHGWIGIKEGM